MIWDDEVLALFHQSREVLQRDIAARAGIVEPTVGVFLDRDRFCGLGHVGAVGSGLATLENKHFLRRGATVLCIECPSAAGMPAFGSALERGIVDLDH
jgi:hypothetical protein